MEKPFEGLIVKEQSGFYWVEDEDGSVYVTELRGRLKEEAQTSDIATIGDRVVARLRVEDGTEIEKGIIEEVKERKSVLSRAVRTSGKRGVGQAEREHVIIANADQAFFVFAVTRPTPNFRMLDHLLVAGEQSEIARICIVANKIDLLPKGEVERVFAPYSDIGYEVIYTSALDEIGVETLKERLRDKISVFTGPSGVGKTSLLNCIQPNLGRIVKEVSKNTAEGVHTTRDSALIKLEQGGYLADTPGIRSLMVWDIEPDELDAYFVDIAPYVEECKFSNCTHSNEPGCAVRAAVERGDIAKSRYKNYLKLHEELRDTYIVYDR